jgi:MFS family permease
VITKFTPVGDEAMYRAGRHNVYALNFFVAAMQTGFGPFVAVWLVGQGWSLTEVGVALSIGTIAGLAAQIPGGALVDRMRLKRPITAVAVVVLGVAALLIGIRPTLPSVWAAEILHSAGSAIITPAIAALTLALSGHDSFSDRLGGNARYAALGSAGAALLFGLAATHFGDGSIFIITAALTLPAVLAVLSVRRGLVQATPEHHRAIAPAREQENPPWFIFRNPTFHVFALCVILFQLGNAGLLSLALGELSERDQASGFVVSGSIIVPALVVALCSPWAGAAARCLGRRAVLTIGFFALPARAVLFAFHLGPEAVIVFEVLDGVSATVLGIMIPLIAADLTAKTGHLNLAIGTFGLAGGLGATFSTTVSGWIADRMGAEAGFLSLALVGAAAAALILFAMPETRPANEAGEPAAAVA